MIYREQTIATAPPLLAADLAFADWVEPLLSEEMLDARAEGLEYVITNGVPRQVGIAALSRFLPRSEHPRSAELTRSWLIGVFHETLADFNEFLDYAGFVACDSTVSALADRDRPALMRVIVETTHAVNGQRQGIRFPLALHRRFPALASDKREDAEGIAATAAAIQRDARHGDQPWGEFFRHAHSAMSSLEAGDPSRAITELATAIEVLVAVLMRECPRCLGWSPDQTAKVENVLSRPGRRSMIENQVSKLLAEKIDLVSRSVGRLVVVGVRVAQRSRAPGSPRVRCRRRPRVPRRRGIDQPCEGATERADRHGSAGSAASGRNHATERLGRTSPCHLSLGLSRPIMFVRGAACLPRRPFEGRAETGDGLPHFGIVRSRR
jgi:hypothetical protein